jgi:hypothetical protein
MRHFITYNHGAPGGCSRSLIAWIMLCAIILLPCLLHAAEKDRVSGTIAIFSFPHANIQINALAQSTAQTVDDVFNRLGRFMPVDPGMVGKALEQIPEGAGEEALLKAAKQVNADLYAVVTVAVMGNVVIGNITINPVSDRYKNIRESITVRSMVLSNIPAKLARELALFHKKIPVEADVVEQKDGLCLLNVGQWHGLAPGRYRTDRGDTVILRNVNRYQSLASLPSTETIAGRVTIAAYPAIRDLLKELDYRVEYNTNYKYGLANAGVQGFDPEKKFAEGMCLINPGANACIPGYGSYLSTAFLGFKNTSPSVPGIVASSLLIVTHFILPEAMTKFRINFFPGVIDDDKTPAMSGLQIFLWSSVPITVSVAFLDQLAHQFTINTTLPPFFMNKNETALVLSLFIPGGGMFYKGHRLPGWGFYLSEMFLAGFCVYTREDSKKVMYGGIALGGVKLIELITAALCPPSFSFYNIEKEGRIQPSSLSLDLRKSEGGDLVYRAGMTFQF